MLITKHKTRNVAKDWFYLQLTISLLVILFIGGCQHLGVTSPGTVSTTPGVSSNPYGQQPDYYLRQAQQANTDDERDAYQIKAAGSLIYAGYPKRAHQILHHYARQTLPITTNNERSLILAEIALMHHDADRALKMLARIKPEAFTVDTQQAIRYHRALAQAYYENQRYLPSTQEYIMLDRWLTDSSQRDTNRISIWRSVKQLSKPDLDLALLEQQEPILQGWLALAHAVQLHQNHPEELLTSIQEWQQRYPAHPAHTLIGNINSSSYQAPQQIALLLPLTGPLSGPGNAVKDGFLAAYYQAQRQGSHIRFKLYDTHKQHSINSLYQQAINNGANFIIGPLDKSNIQKLLNETHINVPVLALNDAGDQHDAQVFQLSLSPQATTAATAIQAWQDGHRRIMVIVPDDAWGKNIANQFRSQWQALGGTVITQLDFSMNDELAEQIQQALHIADSEQRRRTLQSLLHKKLKFIARRRQDMDSIFMAAYPSQARQLIPLLKFYYAGDIPTYALPIAYNGLPGTRANIDLNDIYFSDIPWIFAQGATLESRHQNNSSPWPEQYNLYTRLYALGIDAFNLSRQLPILKIFPNYAYPGATGELSLENQQIIHKLIWAQMQNGQPQLLG
ncbi:MAG: penicillin-binding protein activator [Gammaproteobacteria bacterium]